MLSSSNRGTSSPRIAPSASQRSDREFTQSPVGAARRYTGAGSFSQGPARLDDGAKWRQ